MTANTSPTLPTPPASSMYEPPFTPGVSPVEIASQELVNVLQKIVENAGALLDVTNCSVALLDAKTSMLVTLATLHKTGYVSRNTRFQMNEGVAGWVAEHREPLIIDDASLDPRFKKLGRTPVGSMACVPLMDDGIFIGTLTVSSPARAAFDERKKRMLTIFAEQAVLAITNARQAEIWRAIWDASSDGIALLGADACFIEANAAFRQMFEHSSQQITGMEFLELFGCSDDASSAECQQLGHIQASLKEQRALSYIEVDLPIKGSVRSIGLSITPVSLASSPFSLVITRDITPIRDATRMKANFLSMITHELRSPINAINGYLDLALTGIAGDLNEQQREFIQRARSGSEHLYALVEDLLLVSRADAGQLRLNRGVLCVEEIVANSLEEWELTAKDSHITIESVIPDGLPRLYADGVRLQQVMRNLLSNALRFTPPGGQVTITASSVDIPPREDGRQAAAPGEEQQAITIEVADTGSGIAHEYHERIFERFFQVHLDSSGRASGQGLGLAIVKMIVELHEGRVTVRSIPGKGSTFAFTIPGILS